MAIATYPKRIFTLSTRDFGSPEDGGGAKCPHCGADGRYVHSFLCDDGKVHAAMSGCIKLYGESNQYNILAKMATALQDKIIENKHFASKGKSYPTSS